MNSDWIMALAMAMQAERVSQGKAPLTKEEMDENERAYYARKKDKEELYYDVQEGLVFTKQQCRRLIQQGSNNKIFPIETIEFEMV